MRAAVLGAGAATRAGGLAATWAAVAEGMSLLVEARGVGWAGVDAAEIDQLAEGLRSRDRKREKLMSRAARWAVAAARDAGMTGGERAGVFLGVGLSGGGVGDVAGLLAAAVAGEGEGARIDMARLGGEGLGHVHPLLSFQVLANMPVCHLALEVDARGEGQARLSRGVGTIGAMAEAAAAIFEGRLERAAAGGADAPVNVVGVAQMIGQGRVGLARPWAGPLGGGDGARLGEGGGLLVLGPGPARIALGAAAVADGLDAAIAAALDEAGVPPREVGEAWLGCNGSPGDEGERRTVAARCPAAALRLPKAVLGETLAAGPGIAAALAARSLDEGRAGCAVVTTVEDGAAGCLVLVAER